MTAPRCWNVPPVDRVRTRYGVCQETGAVKSFEVRDDWSSDGCKTWSGPGIGKPTPEYPSGTPYPVAHGWAEWCKTCRWMPEGVAL